MIKFSNQKNSTPNADVNLTPMIDIIFNLLIFFLIVAVISQKGLNLTLPETDTAEKRPEKSLEITVTADKKIIFDGHAIPESELEQRLLAVKNQKKHEGNIILKADVDAPFGLFVKVMDTSRKIGLTNLVIATEQKPPEEN